jgi:S1-C subfamily serine protease
MIKKLKEILSTVLISAVLIVSGMFLQNTILSRRIDSENLKIDFAKFANTIAKETITQTVSVESAGGFGSGVIIKEEISNDLGLPLNYYYVITNYHVIESTLTNEVEVKHMFIETSLGYMLAELIAYDEEKDLALLVFNTTRKLGVAKFAKKSPMLGDVAVLIGSRKFQKNIVTYGNYKGPAFVGNQIALSHNASASPGSSGGGLFNADLELIGIQFRGMIGTLSTGEVDSDYNDSFAIKIETVKKFLKEVKFDLVFRGTLPSKELKDNFASNLR